MKRKKAFALVLCLALSLGSLSAVAAESLAGEWKGTAKVSGLPVALSVTVKFAGDGTFSLSTLGLSASGAYAADGSTLAVRPSKISGILSGMLSSPSSIGEVHLPYAIKDGKLSISVNSQGMQASVSLKKK